jgi:hypothetical protein
MHNVTNDKRYGWGFAFRPLDFSKVAALLFAQILPKVLYLRSIPSHLP